MKEFAEKFLDTKLQTQLFSLVIVTLILVVIAIIIYVKVRKQPVDKAPSGVLLFAEQYVMGVKNVYNQAADGRLEKPIPYIFTLFTFLLFSNLMGIIGLEPATSSYSVTIVLGLISWLGIYVVGIAYQKLLYFKKFINPTEIIGQFAPLITLSFRLFGNLVGGSAIMTLVYYYTGQIWAFIPVIGDFNILGAIVAPAFHAYFDIFSGAIQAFVFSLLTTVYWSMEASAPTPKVVEAPASEPVLDVKKRKIGVTLVK